MGKRTSQLTQLTAAQVAQGDFLPIVDVSAGQTKYVTVKDLTGLPDQGWQSTGESWAYSSWNSTSKIGIVTVPTDATTKYSINMWVRFSQTTGGTKWGKILSVATTTLNIWLPGQTLNNEAITSPVYSTVAVPVGLPVSLSQGNPYEFSAWRSAALTTGTGGVAIIHDTEVFDNTDNFNTTNGRFTAPVTGRYQFNFGQIVNHINDLMYCNLLKNGTEIKRCVEMPVSGSGNVTTSGNAFIDLVAGDYVQVGYNSGANRSFIVGNQAYVWFNGFMVSRI